MRAPSEFQQRSITFYLQIYGCRDITPGLVIWSISEVTPNVLNAVTVSSIFGKARVSGVTRDCVWEGTEARFQYDRSRPVTKILCK